MQQEYQRQQQHQTGNRGPPADQTQQQEQQATDQSRSNVGSSVADMYGAGKAYPEPYLAGRVPGTTAQERRKQRADGKIFAYAVRFRSGTYAAVLAQVAR